MRSLYIFSVSHICEKARWALYYLYIPYELVSLAPGLHSVWASRCGLTSTTLPTLEIDGIYTQGEVTSLTGLSSARARSGGEHPRMMHRRCVRWNSALAKASVSIPVACSTLRPCSSIPRQ